MANYLAPPETPYYTFVTPDGSPDYDAISKSVKWARVWQYMIHHLTYRPVQEAYEQIKDQSDPNLDPEGQNRAWRIELMRRFPHLWTAETYHRTTFESGPKKATNKALNKTRQALARKSNGLTNTNYSPESAVLADILWVYQRLGQAPDPKLASDAGKMGLWTWAYAAPAEFYRTLIPKLLAAEETARKEESERKAKEDAKLAEIERAKSEEERAQAAMLDLDHRRAKERIRAARAILEEMAY